MVTKAIEYGMPQHWDTLEKLVERQTQAWQDGKSAHGGFEASTAGPGPGLAERDLKRAGLCVPSNLFDYAVRFRRSHQD